MERKLLHAKALERSDPISAAAPATWPARSGLKRTLDKPASFDLAYSRQRPGCSHQNLRRSASN
jgi:hypothetical protein